MSQSCERNPHSRWSNSYIHKYSSLHSAPTSEEEKASRAHSPLLTSTHSHLLAQEKLTSACCICCEQCNGLKSSRRSAIINYKKSRQLQATLQVYLIRTQVEEAAMDDKQTTLMQQLSLISNVFEAAVQHMQSLQVSYLAAKRVFDMSHAILARHSSSSANYTNNDFVSYHEQVIFKRT
ncbi:uncharacterized protein LOC114941893 [Nylanderia fulva]|uniref:uncharacterized protein LOC114941893 n=1 Tax=Nylanderia fulva TaxID=613905 RepID=UPI0010FADE7E|nr:uncharacterized protein LOC114941893 [Nylanderia fulva]